MAVANRLYKLPKANRWTRGIGAALPEEYKKFWKEWQVDQPAPVHYVPKEGKYERKEDGTVLPVQNVPLPLKYPLEVDEGIWGGEAVVEGFVKKNMFTRRVKHYWVPQLKKSVLYSEILDKYMRTVVTDRTMKLIHENYGFDHYILKTKACDLKSLLALQLKREMLIALVDKTLYPNDPVKREEVYAKYIKYAEPYTREEIEWYGLSYKDACKKFLDMERKAYKAVPLKHIFRQEYLQELEKEKQRMLEESKGTPGAWLSKINPFKAKETS